MNRCQCLTFVGLFLVAIGPLRGAQPTDEVLALIPDDAHVVLIVQNLRDVWRESAAEELTARLQETLLDDDFVKDTSLGQLKRGIADLAKALGDDAGRLRDDVCGDSLIFVYRGDSADGERGEYGLLLTWCRDVRAAEKIRERIDAAQRKSGELRALRRKPHGNGHLTQRVKAQGDSDFLTQLGPILALSNSEAAIRQTIDRRHEPRENSFRNLWKRVGASHDFITLWLNPRSFDSELMQRAQTAPEEEKPFLETFARLWAAVDAVTVSIDWSKEKSVALNIAYRQRDLPRAWREWLESPSKPRSTRLRMPADCLAVIRAPVNLPAIRDVMRTVLPAEAWNDLSAAAESALLPLFGQKHTKEFSSQFSTPWTLFVTPPLSDDSWLPDVALAIPLAETANARFEGQLRDAMEALTLLLRLRLGAGLEEPIQSGRRVGQNGAEIHFFQHDGLFPKGLQPAYSVQQRHLIWGTNPKVIERLRIEDNDTSGADAPVVEARLAALAKVVGSRAEAWFKLLGDATDPSFPENLRSLRRWLPLFESFEQANLHWEVRDNQAVSYTHL
ncbi:MAG: hypothetical protein N2039_04945, partial [Gemmataceae bacterium]|nr:hypothetical protein [Gemmataceae bacterium]